YLLQYSFYVAGDNASIVLNAYQYDVVFTKVVFDDLVGHALQLHCHRFSIQDIIFRHEGNLFKNSCIDLIHQFAYCSGNRVKLTLAFHNLTTMTYLSQILFVLLLVSAAWLFLKKAREILGNIRLGKRENYGNRPAERLKNLLLLAFGQKKMFRNPLVAILHFVIYAGFVIINIEILEIVLDGVLGTHRLFAPALG